MGKMEPLHAPMRQSPKARRERRARTAELLAGHRDRQQSLWAPLMVLMGDRRCVRRNAGEAGGSYG